MPDPAANLASAMAGAYNAGDMERVILLAAQAGDEADEGILALRGLAEQATGRYDHAVETFRQLAHQQPEVSAYWNNLGVACRLRGDADAAEQALSTARSVAPHDAEVLYNLGLVYIQQRRWPLAREILLDAVDCSPGFVEARLQAAYACYVCADNIGQEAMLAGAVNWPAQPAEQALILAAMLSTQGDLDAALHTLARARLPATPEDERLRLRIAAQRAVLYERSNHLDLARQELKLLPLAALDALPDDASQARAEGWRAHAALAMRAGTWADAAALYRRVLALRVDAEARASAAFGLAASCDRLGRHGDAWQALDAAHAAQLEIAREVVPELLAPDSQPLQVAEVDRAAHARWRPLVAPSSRQSPVFVVGFPRSGTTLLEQMLDAHPEFRSMDERAFIHELTERMEQVGQRYPDELANLGGTEVEQLRATYYRMVGRVLPDLGQHRLVDKNPLNMLCLPMIMRLFPQARIVLCLRHPCDVLLSCSMQSFRSPAFMVLCSSLQRLARGYVTAFEQWFRQVEVFAPRVLEWRYESVVEDLDRHLTELAAFLEVADASPMARFADHARTKRFISTPSYAQVTQGIHPGAVNRWHGYREQFEPVLPLLQPMIDRLGYSR
ncbi:sulfotransferase [Dyella thiooxydans]|uniref:Sulfotransferase n=1 Tax=Dyella thiooxydans TaxID=445710 RepID=A0A160N4M9_9GAMM|nr:sulfotransferase family protein [Dyella thiooxydans]AND70900.1 sulfotransferase [Dyella thiooxydans]